MEPFEKLAIMMEDISGDEGVLKMELSVGVGPDIPKEAQVVFHYSAYLEYADEPFDSTLLRNQPQRAYLNEEDTLPGIKIGLRTMRTKEKARFLIRPQYAFGELGCPPRIPPKATILYEITLLDWNDRSGADTFENLDYEQKVKLSFSQKMKAATDYHKEGNEFYKKNHLLKAKKSYRRATWILENMSVSDAEEEQRQCELLFKMRSNLAQINLDLKEFGRACTECRLALDLPATVGEELKAKLFFRFGKAKMFLNDFDLSRKYLLKAQRLRPNNLEISNLLEDLLKRTKKYCDREKIICQKMMGVKIEDSKAKIPNCAKDLDNVDPLLKRIIENQLKNLRQDSKRE
ncbi:Inactive peptidyl-prolyl cis-trans isomerase FKBP6, partial [Armadillidium nasatum]